MTPFKKNWRHCTPQVSVGTLPFRQRNWRLSIILQAYTGVSDDEAIEATLMDRRGPLVLDCLDTEQTPWSLGTLVAFRKRLIDAHMDRRLVERTIELASQTQEFGSRARLAALDSSPLWGAGRVEDTYNLLGHALKKALRLVAESRGETVTDVGHEAGADIICGPSLKAVLDRDWDQVEQREEVLDLVVQVLPAVEAWVQTLEPGGASIGSACSGNGQAGQRARCPAG